MISTTRAGVLRSGAALVLAVLFAGCAGTATEGTAVPTRGDLRSEQDPNGEVRATPFVLSDEAVRGAVEKLVSALDDGRVAEVLSLLDLSDGRIANFNDCDFVSDSYFYSNSIAEVRERLLLIHDQGTRFELQDVYVGSGATHDEPVPSVAGAAVERFGPGLPEHGHTIGLKLPIVQLEDGSGLFGHLALTSPEMCAQPNLRI